MGDFEESNDDVPDDEMRWAEVIAKIQGFLDEEVVEDDEQGQRIAGRPDDVAEAIAEFERRNRRVDDVLDGTTDEPDRHNAELSLRAAADDFMSGVGEELPPTDEKFDHS